VPINQPHAVVAGAGNNCIAPVAHSFSAFMASGNGQLPNMELSTPIQSNSMNFGFLNPDSPHSTEDGTFSTPLPGDQCEMFVTLFFYTGSYKYSQYS
jgi:hypothetical protein